MRRQNYTAKPLCLAIYLAFPVLAMPSFAAEPYPALPPTLSSSVTPNIMLYIDTSGSMLQDANNAWMLTNICDSNANWSGCVNNDANYRAKIDSETYSPNTKMNIAKRVAKDLIFNNRHLRFGLFSFEDKPGSIGGAERSEAGVLRAGIKDIDAANNDTNYNNLKAAISALNGRTGTPLGEGLLEVTRYFEGKSSLYNKIAGNYTSPIQYRCQKNFAIILTDGDATGDDNLPGSSMPALAYVARDQNGASVPKNFSVCKQADTNAADDLSVNCPSELEKEDGSFTNTNPGFGSGNPVNRFRAIRDVAKYARVADLRVGGNDADGKSFDDVKFAKQNLITYTVALGLDNAVLPAAAKVSGGKYKTTKNESELAAALTAAVDSIVASTSNAGGVATQSEVTTAGNKVFQPVFNPAGWYGQLLCYSLNADGTVGAACTPSPEAVIPAEPARKIHTSKVNNLFQTERYSFVTSNLASLSPAQKLSLGADATEQTKVMRFLRGEESIAGFRSRYNATLGKTILLGDIVDGQPVVVTKPSGSTPEADYASYISSNAARNIVLIGANDGMAHAFDIATMGELMGYIPQAVYPRLKALTATDYGQSAGTPHSYHVNGSMRQQDIKTGTSWKTVVVGGLGQGGQGYYALDATNNAQLSAATSAIKWEYNDINDKSMGYTLGAPLIYNVRTGTNTVVPAAIFANGYESNWDDTASGGQKTTNKESVLTILNAETGSIIARIQVPGSSGLSSPAGLDYGQDGVLDFVYAGDVNGKLWRFDLTDPNNFKVASNPLFDAGAGHPIIMRPGLIPVNKAADGTPLGNVVLFGTGQLLTNIDRKDTTTQTLYGVLDKMESNPSTVSISSLQQQQFETSTYSKTTTRIGTYRKISASDDAANKLDIASAANLALSAPKMGWYINLPDSSERLVTSPMVFEDRVLFGTGVPISTEQCLPGGSGWIVGVNPLTGSVVRKNNKSTGADFSFIDITGDGKSTAADKLGTGPTISYMSAYKKDGIPTELSFVSSNAVLSSPSGSDGGLGNIGNVIALREANSMAVYTGNATPGTTRGISIARQASNNGCVYGGVLGKSDLDKDCLPPAPSGAVKIETTLWREIK
jgi:type IV pilus assembly protein PilY1